MVYKNVKMPLRLSPGRDSIRRPPPPVPGIPQCPVTESRTHGKCIIRKTAFWPCRWPSRAHGREPARRARPGPVASENAALDVNAGEAYTQFIVSFKDAGQLHAQRPRERVGRRCQAAGGNVRELRTLATGGTLIASDKALSTRPPRTSWTESSLSGAVNAVEPDARMTAVLSPNDTRYGEQSGNFTGANGMRIPGAWDVRVRGHRRRD